MPSRPNIVLIMTDQHNPHVCGFAGNGVARTPSLDALAREGVRFTNAYCPSPLCVPSRIGFMTAKYPSRSGIYDNGGILAPGEPTFAHALTQAGYETVLCGRMHFEGEDQYHGFERRIAGDCMHWLTEETRGTRPLTLDGQTAPAVAISGYGRTGYQAYDELVTRRACDFVGTRMADARPFCTVVGMMLPHNPLIARRDLFEHYLECVRPEALGAADPASVHPALRAWRTRRGVDTLTPEQIRRATAAYYALVEEMDANVGRIAATARAADPDCVVIYTTDHGDMAGEHGMWWKSCFFEGSARVPLIVSSPSCFAGGRTVDAVVSLMDLGPTLLDWAGSEPMPDADGRSLAPFVAGGVPKDWPNETFSEYGGAHGDQPSCMVRSGDWKLMYYPEFESCLLFNLREDPKELCDRAADPACARLVEELRSKILSRWSAKSVADGMERQRLARLAGPKPPWPAAWEFPKPEDNAFDRSQIPG